MKQFSNFLLLAFVTTLGIFALSSCQEDLFTTETGISSTIETRTTETIESIQSKHKMGKYGCYELVFPVTVEFADSTSIEVNDYQEMFQAVKDWYKENGKDSERPTLQFPFEVLDEDGELLTVESEEDVLALLEACDFEYEGDSTCSKGNHGSKILGENDCFEYEFPITIIFPDSSDIAVDSYDSLQVVIEEWKDSNDTLPGHPVIEVPFDIYVFADSLTVTIDSLEQFHEIIEDCNFHPQKDGKGGKGGKGKGGKGKGGKGKGGKGKGGK